ncbi:hypothetical protein B0H16DRAFT_880371 [Mycena metata]|uniref:Uncharacterized protein n=1 Tax=Mycena metata TaxID=1033252 RepID=A0AAD7NVY5_9AGAR|nr:hypothetical protein B0H16DRAFT_880371 [Mycena metata]
MLCLLGGYGVGLLMEQLLWAFVRIPHAASLAIGCQFTLGRYCARSAAAKHMTPTRMLVYRKSSSGVQPSAGKNWPSRCLSRVQLNVSHAEAYGFFAGRFEFL